MKYLLFVMTLACVTSLGAPLAFADDDDFEKLMIQRKKPVYRDAAPERSYQDDDPADTPPPRAKKAKKIKHTAAQEPTDEAPQRVETGGITKTGDGYVVTLLGCQRIGNKLACTLNITNNSKHNSFAIGHSCRAVDNFGNTYDSLDSYAVGGETDGSYHKVLSGMSANGSFSLTVTPNARNLSKLIVHINNYNKSNMEFEVNNIGL